MNPVSGLLPHTLPPLRLNPSTQTIRWAGKLDPPPPEGPIHQPSDDRLKNLTRDNIESGLKLKKKLGARAFYARAIELAEMIGVKEPLLMKAYSRFGYHLLYYRSIPEDAVEKKKAERQPWENPENAEADSYVYEDEGVKRGRLERAHTYLLRAFHLSKPLHDREVVAAGAEFEKDNVLVWLGDSFREQNNPNAAITHYLKYLARLVSTKQDRTNMAGYTFWKLSLAHNDLGDYDHALEASTRAVDILRANQSEDYLVSSLNHHADLLNRTGNYDEISEIRAEITAFETAQKKKKKKDDD